ncbi:RNA cap guanine-N2 methyltransferase-domain-containing protein, partial [Scheffersomyces amazonensis]|uniref:RNA cap guanine-N2 methyltransferase-domain-containing protein n=1 Tax=Scheffersomyces amazonensis TaxID=1078765 RepID=UPI00315CB3E2
MHTYETLPSRCKKFWSRRYQLFSRFDDGVYMTSELWYSVTPESIAIFTARVVKYLLPDAKNILDVCCGGGGNLIQFAYYFDNVGGIDINLVNARCSMHNAEIYEIDEDGSVPIHWVPEDLRKEDDIDNTFDFIFCSPPWGGTSYNRGKDSFDLYEMHPFPIDKLVQSMLQYTRNVGLFLPKSSNLDQL